jgi:RNA polymerase sigma-70 factor (ECF subfamily)
MSVNQQNKKLDAQGFEDLHRLYHDLLLNSMTGMVRDREAAEDITATALGTAFEKLGSFRGESSLYTWVYAIALNEARRQGSQKRTLSLDALETAPKELTEPDRVADGLDRSVYRDKMLKALDAIPAGYRRILADHFVHDHTVKQIARRERIPAGTVLSRIFTGKRLLRQAWEAMT